MLSVILLLIAVAILAGFLSGFFGIGGGVILVPSLLWILPHWGSGTSTMHGAVATSLALLIPTSGIATLRQLRFGHLDLATLRFWGLGIVIGAVIGGVIADRISSRHLTYIFVGFMVFALFMQLIKEFIHQTETNHPSKPLMLVASSLIGGMSTILGIGGGLFSGSALRLLKYPLRNAIALSTASAVIIGAVGSSINIYTGIHALGRAEFSVGYVNVLAFMLMAPLMMSLSPVGVRVAHHLSQRILSRLYLFFLLIMILIMVYKII